MTTNRQADAARETARQDDGRFGVQSRAEAGSVDLGLPKLERTVESDHFFADAYYRQRAVKRELDDATVKLYDIEHSLRAVLPGGKKKVRAAQERLVNAEAAHAANKRVVDDYRRRYPDFYASFDEANRLRTVSAPPLAPETPETVDSYPMAVANVRAGDRFVVEGRGPLRVERGGWDEQPFAPKHYQIDCIEETTGRNVAVLYREHEYATMQVRALPGIVEPAE